MIEVKELEKSYGDVRVLRGVNFSLSKGAQCIIKGASGSGKSTFLYLLGGLERIDRGSVVVEGLSLHRCSDEELAHYRNISLGFIFQFHFLLSSMKVIDNIYLPARIGPGITRQIKDRVYDIVQFLGVEHCLKKYPHQLSGGEQQRVNIVRACSLAPQILLCDEPTGNLDSENTQRVVKLLKDISHDLVLSLILVTHDQEVAGQFREVLTMHDGQIVN